MVYLGYDFIISSLLWLFGIAIFVFTFRKHILKIIYPQTNNHDYAECIFPQMAFVGQNRLSDKPNIVDGEWTFKKHAAYHFDATLFAAWLKESSQIPSMSESPNDPQ